MKRLLKDKRGMSLMEILVAFSLLLIVIVGTTPILLSAYDGLYTAGVFTQDTYDAKTEIEDQLATRSSSLELQNFAVNFNNLGEVTKINAKRAVSTLVSSLETIFTGGRAYITIVSGNTVNDDATSHEITVQVSNYKLESFDEICDLQDYGSKDPNKIRLAFDVIIPSKSLTANTENRVYHGSTVKNADVEILETKSNLELGRITIKIKGDFDFTTSPLKIQIYYYDEDGELMKTSDYLHIKTPTIIAAGKTTTNHYYTTSGVVSKKNKATNVVTTTFDIEGRTMSTGTYQSTQSIPADTIFKSVNWVTESIPNEERSTTSVSAQATNPFETSYYVLTGTNGAIYRTYSQVKVGTIGGRVSFNASCGDSNFGINGLDLNSYTKMNQLDGTDAKDVMGVNEASFNIDSTGDVIYPAGWSGDFSHIFGFSAYETEAGYTERTNPANTNGAWYTQQSYSEVVTNVDGKNTKGKGSEGYFSNLACYGYYYNGYALNTPYWSMNSRKISYILTEKRDALRVGGYMGDVGSAKNYGYDGTTFDRIWERPSNSGDGRLSGWSLGGIDDEWFYPALGDTQTASVPRSAILYIKKDEGTTDDKSMLPVYLAQGGNVNRNRADNGLAQLRLKALTTLSPTAVYDRGGDADEKTDMRVAYQKDYNKSKITVTDAVYLPATDSTSAGMFYIGTVAAYGMVNQSDNVGLSNDSPDVKEVHARQTANAGRLTSYWIVSNDVGTQTTIYKHSTKDEYKEEEKNFLGIGTGVYYNDIPHGNIRARLMNESTRNSTLYNNGSVYGLKSTDLKNSVKANTTESHQFFISQPLAKDGSSYKEQVSGRIFSDVAFTMGYTSNREMVYTNIVYGTDGVNLIQSLKFCEPYYFLSHYDDAEKIPNLYMNSTIDTSGATHTLKYNGVTENSLNSPNNDYYNVWFPGEMYNLTKVATKDGVTVAVGYAVAGSAYSYLNTKNNASTALGGVFNDGVLAGMVLGEDSAFKNLLYYKDNDSFDAESLTNGTVKFEQHGTAGQDGSWVDYNDIQSGWTSYGTHARNSIQFTAVELSVENAQTTYEKDESGNIVKDENGNDKVVDHTEEYYAYYADNRGRVFRSLVATKDKSGNIEMVNHIADQEKTDKRSAPSYMEEQKIGTESFDDYLEKITSINAAGDYILVTGHPKDGDNKFYIIVGKKSDNGSSPTWKVIEISNEDDPNTTDKNEADIDNFLSNDGLVLDGYFYVVGGYRGSDVGGWINATKISDIEESFVTGDAIPHNAVGTADTLYAIDGHS